MLGFDEDFLDFFAGFANGGGIVVCSARSLIGSFVLLFLERAWPTLTFTMAGSSLAFLSVSPGFFHAGTCFSTVEKVEDMFLTEPIGR